MKTPPPNIESDTRGSMPPIDKADQADFNNMVDLLAVFSEATNRLEQIQADVNQDVLQLVDEHKKDYAGLQKALTDAEGGLEVLARRHPDWFKVQKTIKTPYGTVSLKNNPPKLVTKNEEVSILLIQQAGERKPTLFDAQKFLRQTTELNLEALAGLTDEELAEFRITREQGDTFAVKPAALDLGKAIKSAASQSLKETQTSDPAKN